MGAADFLAVAGGEQDRQLGETAAHFLRQLDAADAAGHHDIGKDELGLVAAGEPFERFAGAVDDIGLEAQLAQQACGELGDQLVVLDHEHPAASVSRWPWSGRSGTRLAGK